MPFEFIVLLSPIVVLVHPWLDYVAIHQLCFNLFAYFDEMSQSSNMSKAGSPSRSSPERRGSPSRAGSVPDRGDVQHTPSMSERVVPRDRPSAGLPPARFFPGVDLPGVTPSGQLWTGPLTQSTANPGGLVGLPMDSSIHQMPVVTGSQEFGSAPMLPPPHAPVPGFPGSSFGTPTPMGPGNGGFPGVPQPIRFPVPSGTGPPAAGSFGQLPFGYSPYGGPPPNWCSWYPYGYQPSFWPMQSPPVTSAATTVTTTTSTTPTPTSNKRKRDLSESSDRSEGSTVVHDEQDDRDAVSIVAPSNDRLVREGRNLPPHSRSQQGSVPVTVTTTPQLTTDSSAVRSSGTPTPSEHGGDGEEETAHYFTFAKAVNEVFRFLPEEVCPRIPSTSSKKFEGFLDAAAGLETHAPMHLPMPPLVDSLVSSIEESGSRAEASAWSVPRSVLSSNLRFNWKAYQFSRESFPLTVPPLDEDASRLGLKAPSSLKVPSKSMTKWETRARQLLGICSYNNAFVGALHQALKEDQAPVVSIQMLLEALNQSSRHASAVSLSLAAELLQARREDTLASCSSISDNGKRKLRSAPLASKTLFGGLVSEVAEAEHNDSLRQAAASSYKRPNLPSSSKKKGGGGHKQEKKTASAAPSTVQPQAPSRDQQRGAGGRRRGNSTQKSPFSRKHHP